MGDASFDLAGWVARSCEAQGVPANARLGCGFHNKWRNHHPDNPGPDPP